jgi:ubiquinone/menaquinone biosynthesis C-methylase UbiE
MPIINALKQLFQPVRQPESEPAEAYDIWAENYDNQPNNLMLALDQALCEKLFTVLSLRNSTIVDIGCGTGRHWSALFNQSPARLAGYDVSKGMLSRLQKKYPQAETHLLSGVTLTGLADDSCDLVLSTLTVAHLPDLNAAFTEWTRVLKPGGNMLITDYHPAALAKGGQRTFREGDRLIAVRNQIYPITLVLDVARRLGLNESSLIERKVDETMLPWYEQQNALPVYRRFLGVPIIYGLRLTKLDAPQ